MIKAHRPTPQQTEWIKENFKKYQNKDIAEKFKISEAMVSVWFKYVGVSKCRKQGYIKQQPETRQIKFLSSEYSNITREQHVDRILSMPL